MAALTGPGRTESPDLPVVVSAETIGAVQGRLEILAAKWRDLTDGETIKLPFSLR